MLAISNYRAFLEYTKITTRIYRTHFVAVNHSSVHLKSDFLLVTTNVARYERLAADNSSKFKPLLR